MTIGRLYGNLKSSFVLALSVAVAVAFGAPDRAEARNGDAAAAAVVGAIFLGAAYCASNPGKCGGRTQGRSGGGGPTDAIALSRDEAMWIQGGLQSLGLYQGAIDGALGSGSRAAVRAYQGAIGEAQTGALTGKQINDLTALSPVYASYPADDRVLFNADRANDLDRDGVRQLQAALNARGFNAGPVDGAFGRGTASAVASYKAANGLPGKPVASRRLLAQMMGWAAPEPAGLHLAAARVRPSAPAAPLTPVNPAPTPAATPAPAAAPLPFAPTAQSFDILGVELGMSEAQVKGTLMSALGGSLMFDSADATLIGADGPVTRGFLALQPNWPEAPAEQVLVLFDDARPELGALAVVRMIRMPEGVDQAVFDAEVLPDIIANYGGDRMVPAANRWVGGAAAGLSADGAECGAMALSVDPAVDNALAALWRSGGGPRFEPGALSSIAADCGEVLDVRFTGSVIEIGLWNSSALAAGGSGAGAAPKIKF